MADRGTQAIFLDAMGTLVELEPPWRRLRDLLPAEIGEERVRRAMKAEMAYYRAHAHEGRDPDSLAELRLRCARLLSDRLGAEITVDELLAAIRLRPYPDVEPALTELRERGLVLVVVSNWDCSLRSALERCGIAPLLDGIVSSAEAGASKPDPAIFELALRIAGCEPHQALHVGDTPEEDLAGARAAAVSALLVDRDGEADDEEPGTRRISSLGEIVEHL